MTELLITVLSLGGLGLVLATTAPVRAAATPLLPFSTYAEGTRGHSRIRRRRRHIRRRS